MTTKQLIPINISSVRLDRRLPFSLYNADGSLVMPIASVIKGADHLAALLRRSSVLYVDVSEKQEYERAFLGKLHGMMQQDKPLSQIADITLSDDELTHDMGAAPAQLGPEQFGPPDWLDLQTQANNLLRHSHTDGFLSRLDRLHGELEFHIRTAPDATLFALLHLASDELRLYSATHAMLVWAVARLAACDVLQWPDHELALLGRAALTMNIGMTELQDQLALQAEPLTSDQIYAVEQHAENSVALLHASGVDDPLWLDAVRRHHDRVTGPLIHKSPGARVARLIQRTDNFAARVSPRGGRAALPITTAMQGCYFDENHAVDEAGAALIKAVGLYPPGSYVRLASQEVAVVVKRGDNASTPRVAVLLNRQGLPTGEPILRESSQPGCRITGGVARHDVRIQFSLKRLLMLV